MRIGTIIQCYLFATQSVGHLLVWANPRIDVWRGLNVEKWGTKLLERGMILRKLVSVSPTSCSHFVFNRFK